MEDNKTRPRIYRHSWWESAVEKRKFVIVGLLYQIGINEPCKVEVLEFGKPESYQVQYRIWQDQITEGKLTQII